MVEHGTVWLVEWRFGAIESSDWRAGGQPHDVKSRSEAVTTMNKKVVSCPDLGFRVACYKRVVDPPEEAPADGGV